MHGNSTTDDDPYGTVWFKLFGVPFWTRKLRNMDHVFLHFFVMKPSIHSQIHTGFWSLFSDSAVTYVTWKKSSARIVTRFLKKKWLADRPCSVGSPMHCYGPHG